jgi:UDP-glucose 4-epimerase
MTTVLVAGGAGYIGSHTVKELVRSGFRTVVFDNLSSGRREFAAGAELVVGDLADREAIRRAFRGREIAAVLHFASLIRVGESYADPRKYYTHNLITALNLLDAVLEAGVPPFIFSSSAAVYGIPRKIPIPEDHPIDPFNPYGVSKAVIERILPDYGRAYGLRYVSLRYFNAAGADAEDGLGETHDPETHLIPNILLAGLGKKDGLDVYGTDFPTPDGTAIRDYVHVTDLAAAHVLALKALLAGEPSEVLNLGTNRGYSVREVIAKAEEVTGRKVAVRERPRREGDVPILLASKEKAERLLGWETRHSGLETIIETAWRWHSSRA